MTIINFIEIDDIEYTSNNIKESIKTNTLNEDKLKKYGFSTGSAVTRFFRINTCE